MFLLDTDHIGLLQRDTDPASSRLRLRMGQYLDWQFYFPIVSFHEQFIGWHGYVNRASARTGVVHGYAMFEQVLNDFAKAQVAPFDDAAADEFESLRAGRVRIGTMDLRIAAIALTRRFTVLSRNLVDFQKVPRLSVEDWTAP
jgi:tRNA(fMet)-specific endonuclease VapC